MKNSSGVSQEAIKYFAMLTMLINHIGSILMPEHTIESSLMKAIGYFTAVTMCYFLVEGYYHTSSKEGYSRRLLIFAVVSQLPYMLAFSGNSVITFHWFNMDIPFPGFSMIFTLWICFQLLVALDRSDLADQKGYAIGLVCLTGLGDWPFLAPLFVWAFRQAYLEDDEKKRRQKTIKAYGAAMALFVVYEIILNVMEEPLVVMLAELVGGLIMIALSGVCIIYLYKGRRRGGSSFFSKWFFYGFYPLHLLILGIIRLVRL